LSTYVRVNVEAILSRQAGHDLADVRQNPVYGKAAFAAIIQPVTALAYPIRPKR